MKQLKFTVIIPTRERIQTLAWTIQTITQQQYENLEIIISDNFSQDGTTEYVKSLTDPRIKYINTGKRVGMTDNWEFALNHATGDFVTFIGDDDGMAIGALDKCNEILTSSGTVALIWKKAGYIWSGHSAEFISNTLEIPVKKEILQMDAMSELREIMTFRKYKNDQIPAYFLPCLYNGFVKKDILDKAREKQGGVFFHSKYPDIYSSILLPFFIDSYLFSSLPIGVNGASGQSNGSGIVKFTVQKKHQEAERFDKETTIPVHCRLKFTDFASIPFITMESYLQVCDSLKIEPVHFNIDNLAKEAIAYAKRFTPETLPWTIESIKETCRINNHPFTYESDIARRPGLLSRIKKSLLSLLRLNKSLYVFYLRKYRGKDIEILKEPYENNILGACRLTGKKLGFTK